METYQRAVAEINLDALQHNIKEIKKQVQSKSQIMAVIKADAYGHGAVEVAEVLIQQGVSRLAVAILEEGIQLRKAGIQVPILVFGYISPSQASKVIDYQLTPTVFTYEMARAFSEAGAKQKQDVPIHIKIDTGMGRVGFLAEEKSVKEVQKIKSLPNLFLEGIYTHFSTADAEERTFTEKQINKFNHFIQEIENKGIQIPIQHAANSAGIMEFTEGYLNIVRAGIILYGLYPSVGMGHEKDLSLQPVMSLKSHIVHIKEVEKNIPIGYRRTYVTDKRTRVATIPVGYGDGYSRGLSNKGTVLIGGKRAPIIGRICMDQCMVDITHIPEAKIEDEVVLLGRQGSQVISAQEIADLIETIPYDVVCMVGKRIPRIYIKNQQQVKMNHYF
ncbi:MAG: alanine racemase [Epulopiscium sp.]|nr:alanine racemase [Candidatus Epulonipiscium sp.]